MLELDDLWESIWHAFGSSVDHHYGSHDWNHHLHSDSAPYDSAFAASYMLAPVTRPVLHGAAHASSFMGCMRLCQTYAGPNIVSTNLADQTAMSYVCRPSVPRPLLAPRHPEITFKHKMIKARVVLHEMENIHGEDGSKILWDAEYPMGGKTKLTSNMLPLPFPKSKKPFMTQMCPTRPDHSMGKLGKRQNAIEALFITKEEKQAMKDLLAGEKDIENDRYWSGMLHEPPTYKMYALDIEGWKKPGKGKGLKKVGGAFKSRKPFLDRVEFMVLNPYPTYKDDPANF
eukprot:gnl/MRDRNA2_/MRDRNA2_35958_c0_seq1.p1 gnl/MRDRNA2_/MRDRNA2_35958_c0~~gnl/MRDRNA2_/MRDRNA2_35958_c0_seq1.p1  ORF type:complete len:286 (+),score=42.19 gnl/MRDRNA2_/MRDRNA2_35958_c0_seq1:34-891(+)